MTRKITTMGGGLADCGAQLIGLAAWSLIALALAWCGTRKILSTAQEEPAAHV